MLHTLEAQGYTPCLMNLWGYLGALANKLARLRLLQSRRLQVAGTARTVEERPARPAPPCRGFDAGLLPPQTGGWDAERVEYRTAVSQEPGANRP